MSAIKSSRWQQLVEVFSPVMQLVHNRMRWGAVESSRYAAEIFADMQAEYTAQIGEELAVLGCGRFAQLENPTILQGLKMDADNIAAGVIDTYNRDLAYAIQAIRTETPTANRAVYARRLSDWQHARSGWKNAQISLNSHMAARNAAVKEFVRRNQVVAEAVVSGPDPAAEPACQALIDGAPYPANSLPADFPIHPNCPHSWMLRSVETPVDCDRLWIGGD